MNLSLNEGLFHYLEGVIFCLTSQAKRQLATPRPIKMSQILVPSALLVLSLFLASGWADWIMQSAWEMQTGFCCVICLATKQPTHLCQSHGLSNMQVSATGRKILIGALQLLYYRVLSESCVHALHSDVLYM